MKRITAIVSGRIQNVGYRARVVGIAKEFMLTGNVQNLEGDRVKIIAEGEEEVLKGFLGAIRIKNTLINVDDVDVEYSGASGEYADFYKLVGTGETDERLDKASYYLKELIVVTKNGFGEMKDEMRTGFGDMKGEMRTGFGEMKEEMRTGFGDMKDEMRTGFGDMKDEMRTGFGDMKDEMRTGFGEVKEEIVGVKGEITEMKGEMRTGFETLSSKQDKTTDEIRALRGDLKSYIEWRTEKLRSELKEDMRTGFNELKRELAAQELCADVMD